VAEDLALVSSFTDLYLYRQGKLLDKLSLAQPIEGAAFLPGALVLFHPGSWEKKDAGENPLVVVRSLETGHEEVWWRSTPRKETDPYSLLQSVDGVATKDGGLWTVGVYDGKVRRFDRQGKVRWQGQLPLPEEKEDPEAVAQLKEELKAQALKDATRRPPTSVEVELAPQERVAAVGRWNDSLVVVAKGAAAGKVFVVRDNPPEMLSFQLPESLATQSLAVTAEGLWFWEPLGLLPWSAVEEQLGNK
jgi:xanthine/CO dehydrogenase XdhC/CoxF family maturation factor